jgi:hypothetical protein
VKLPNAEQALIELIKLRDYCLNPRHPRGRHKARIFEARLGLTASHAEWLRDAILRVLPEADALAGPEDRFGRRFVVDCPVSGPRGSGVVRTAWIILRGESVPRLTTCYIM